MDSPRAEKVAVVDEVRARLDQADASIVTEYRGLTVAEIAELRRTLAAAGSDYKVFKNTLARLAVAGSAHEPLEVLLDGPTAIAFVHGDISAVAKTLRDFSRSTPSLVVKGGLLGGGVLSASDLGALAELPPRDVLLALFAGALAAPMRQLGGLLEALPRNLAFGLAALIDRRRDAGEDAGDDAGAPEPATAADDAGAPEPAAAADHEPST